MSPALPRPRELLARCALPLAMLLAAPATGAPQDPRRQYDISALPLDIALSRFSEASGVDVLLRDPMASRHRSRPIRGDLTPAEALAAMLEGSGLVARFTSMRSAVIVPVERANEPWIAASGRAGESRALLSLDMMRVTAPRLVGSPRTEGDEAFAQRLAVSIRSFVTEQAAIEGGKASDFRIATRITAEGTLYNVRVVRGSGDRIADGRIAGLLEGARLGLVPPATLRQPLLFEVTGR